MDHQLKKSLTVGGAVALAFGMVMGAGLLVLPGLAYSQIGAASIYAWLSCAFLVIPLLVIFSYLGSKFPSAGGIAGFARRAFGDGAGAAIDLLLIGTFSLGIPAIAAVGGSYLIVLLDQPDNFVINSFFTALLLLLAGYFNIKGLQASSKFQQVVTFSLILIFVLVTLLGFMKTASYGVGTGIAPLSDWPKSFPVIGTIFFAFTGWEMLSFTTEEYQNPKRDYPLAVFISFIGIVALYLGIAWTMQHHLSPQDPQITSAPVAALFSALLGPSWARLVSLVAVLIIIANLNSAVMASSRLFFASARAGILPKHFAKVNPVSLAPARAIILSVSIFILMGIISHLGVISQGTLLAVAGQNFFLLYLVSVAAFIKIVPSKSGKLFGMVTLISSTFIMFSFGLSLLYSLGLLGFGYFRHRQI
jgi:amino acid efflux transporter